MPVGPVPLPGTFVWTSDEFGIGKIRAIDNRRCTVEFRTSVDLPVESRDYDRQDLRRAFLGQQTRVYVRDDEGGWRVGRVIDHLDRHAPVVTYLVRFPNKQDQEFGEDELEVRCFRPLPDPSGVLASLALESQFLQDRRLAALQAFTRKRATSRGLTALMSSAIELIPHQVEVVRRVLEDPVQRYILADEVGLGKTIEAGIIVRQFLLDVPQAGVVIAVPPPLVQQWSHELQKKFFTEDFPGRVRVTSFSELRGISPTHCEMLVVDEAHHLVSDAPEFYEDVKRLALNAERVLLLSATPVIGNESNALSLLHLLDPEAYPLNELEQFREKVSRRQEFGRLLLGLKPDRPLVLLRQTSQRLMDALPDDAIVQELAPAIAGDTPSIRLAAARELKRHIANTYRIYHRLLRSRRKDLAGWELLERRGQLNPVEVYDEGDHQAIEDSLSQWRYASRRHLLEASVDPQVELLFAGRFARLFESLSGGPIELREEVLRQLSELASGMLVTFPEDESELRSIEDAISQSDLSVYESYAQLVAEVMAKVTPAGGEPMKIAVFTTSTAAAMRVFKAIRDCPETRKSRLITADLAPEAVEKELAEFRGEPYARVLVCDRSGEEGLNLQFVHAILHLDLPLSPARVEQRIGRLDRFGRQDPVIRHRVLLPSEEEGSPWHAWFELLRDAFRVFDQSISDVQFHLDVLQKRIELALYRDEAAGLLSLTEEIRAGIAEERERLDEQYALDQLEMGEDDARLVFERFQAEESDVRSYKDAVDPWLFEALRFGRYSVGHDTFNLAWSDNRTLLPYEPWHDLALPFLNRPTTYDREVASMNLGVSLLRPGSQFIDVVERFMRWDDRGTASATWRIDQRWREERRDYWLGFRLCYIVQSDIDGVFGRMPEDLRDKRLLPALRRHADAYLPPSVEVCYVDLDLKEVKDPILLEILSRPYRSGEGPSGKHDYNLGSRPSALNTVIAMSQFQQIAREVRGGSETRLRTAPDFAEHVRVATDRAGVDFAARDAQLRHRIGVRDMQLGLDASLEREILLNDVILKAVSEPAVTLDSINFFVIAGDPPPGNPAVVSN